MTRKRGSTQSCTSEQAKGRLRDAHAQLQLAEMAGTNSSAEEIKAATSCAVLAGIAAADAACCKALGERSRSRDHRDAVDVLKRVAHGGVDAAKDLERLLGLKDASRYDFGDVAGQKHLQAVRRAKALLDFADEVLRR